MALINLITAIWAHHGLKGLFVPPPPSSCIEFLSRTGFSTPAARRVPTNFDMSRFRAFRDGRRQHQSVCFTGISTPYLPSTLTLKLPVEPLVRSGPSMRPTSKCTTQTIERTHTHTHTQKRSSQAQPPGN